MIKKNSFEYIVTEGESAVMRKNLPQPQCFQELSAPRIKLHDLNN